MRTILRATGLVVIGMFVGCGQPVPVETAVPESSEHHGGVLVPLSDKEVYVELLNGERKNKGTTYDTTLVAYLFQSDQKTPIAEKPASVQVKVGTPNGDQLVTLNPAPDSADPLGSARFVSATGPFELTQNGGEVTVQVGGKTLTGSFRGPR